MGSDYSSLMTLQVLKDQIKRNTDEIRDLKS